MLRTFSASVLFTAILSLAQAVALAQPAINKGGVVNAASYSSPIAQGSLFLIFGVSLGPANLVSAPSLPLGTRLPDANGTAVKVTSNGVSADAFLYYTSATQVAAILPSTTPLGPVDITVTYNGQTSLAERVTVVKSSPGIFTYYQRGSGPARAQLYKSATDVSDLALTNSAQAGETLVLYGTGLGPVNSPDNVAPGAVKAAGNVTVFINGTAVQPSYAGRSPQYPGLDQINIQLPASLTATGCYTPAVISVDGQSGNNISISTASQGRVCTHPLNLNAAALAKLDAGQRATVGLFVLLPSVSVFGFTADAVAGAFITADGFGIYTSSSLAAFNQPSLPLAPGTCAVFDQSAAPAGGIPNLDVNTIGVEVNAGNSLTLTGPGGKQLVLTRQATGGYVATSLTQVFDPGVWTLAGTGGDIGPFTATITLPARLKWTNPPAQGDMLTRGDVPVAWTGGGEVVAFAGTSTLLDSGVGKQFTCAFPGGAGKATLPANIVSQLPAAPSSGNYLGSLSIATGGATPFSIPGKIDAGAISFGTADLRLVAWK